MRAGRGREVERRGAGRLCGGGEEYIVEKKKSVEERVPGVWVFSLFRFGRVIGEVSC